jgi:hypothetical protein
VTGGLTKESRHVSATATPAGHSGAMDWRARLAAARILSSDSVAIGGLLLTALVFYFPLVFQGRALVDYDAFVYFYPQRAHLARALLSGQIPLWNPDLFMGAPFLANPQTAALYPPSWLFVLGPVHAVYTVQLVLHGFLAVFFTYALLRRAFGVLPVAAVAGGLAYAFGGFAVGQVGHLNQISAAAWLPAVLLAYDRFQATRRSHWIALGALALALQLLAGHPQETYMTLIVLALFGVVSAPWRHPSRLVLVGVGGVAMCILGGALAAAQLLPTLELAPLSIRGEGVNWKDAVAGSLPSYLSVRVLFPPFWVRVPNTEFLAYAGVTAVTLGLLALIGGRVRPVFFGALVCGLGLFLALGENNGSYPLIFASVPGFDTFRVPARWLLLWEFGAAVLAALGADWIGRGAQVWPRRPTVLARAVVVALVVMAGLAWQVHEGEQFNQRRTPAIWAVLAAATLAAGALPHLGRPMLAMGVVVLLTGGELWAAADASPARQAPPATFTAGETVDWLRAQGVTDAERLLSLARPEYVPVSEPSLRAGLGDLPEPIQYALVVAQKWHDTLTPNVPLQYGYNTADGYDGGVLPLLRWVRLSTLVVAEPRPDGVLLSRLEQLPSDRVLDLLGVRYLIANSGVAARPGLPVAVDFGDLRIFARPDPVPRDLIVFSATSATSDDAALARMRDPSFDPNREVVLSGGQGLLSGAAPSIPVTPTNVSAGHWQARVRLAQDGYLLQREAWYPGWRARVDGIDVPVLRADVLFRAVPLTAGEHDVEVDFVSETFQRGLLISLAALGMVALLFALPIIRTRVRR